MWLFTTEGFYSVVTAEEFDEELQVRARCEDDLDRLRESHFPKLGPNVSMRGRDYPWRAFTTRVDLAEAMSSIALGLDYSNFKNAVSVRQSSERAHIYANVWSACRKIPSHDRGVEDNESQTRKLVFKSRTEEYRGRDLQTEGAWPLEDGDDPRYGGVVFNSKGEVLLREPRGWFDKYHWTFSKGAPYKKDKHPVDTARRETLEETGYEPEIIGHIPGVFKGGNTLSANCFYLMLQEDDAIDKTVVSRLRETTDLRWASQDKAVSLISETKNPKGRERDLETLSGAYNAFKVLTVQPDPCTHGNPVLRD